MAMKKKSIIGTSVIFLLMVLLVGQVWAASPLPQTVFTTPTPGSAGEIRYVVQDGENCLGISLKLQMDLNELRTLNGLDEACAIQPGQELLVGFGATQTPVPVNTPTPDLSKPTPTVFVGSGSICVFLFNDINGDGVPGDQEYPIADGAISISDKENRISETKNTVWDSTSVCFDEIPEGEYNISVAPPQGYNPTSNMNYALILQAGQTSKVNFGAQQSSEAPVEVEGEEGDQTGNVLLAVLGVIMVLGGIVLGVYFWMVKK